MRSSSVHVEDEQCSGCLFSKVDQELFVERTQFNEQEQIKALFDKPIHWEDQDWQNPSKPSQACSQNFFSKKLAVCSTFKPRTEFALPVI